MALTVKESLETPTHTYSLMGTDRPTHLHINNHVTDKNSVMVPRNEVIDACHITLDDLKAALAEHGLVAVPKEPTQKVVASGQHALRMPAADMEDAYKAMIQAAEGKQ